MLSPKPKVSKRELKRLKKKAYRDARKKERKEIKDRGRKGSPPTNGKEMELELGSYLPEYSRYLGLSENILGIPVEKTGPVFKWLKEHKGLVLIHYTCTLYSFIGPNFGPISSRSYLVLEKVEKMIKYLTSEGVSK